MTLTMMIPCDIGDMTGQAFMEVKFIDHPDVDNLGLSWREVCVVWATVRDDNGNEYCPKDTVLNCSFSADGGFVVDEAFFDCTSNKLTLSNPEYYERRF